MKLLQTDLSDLQQNKGPKLPSCFSPLVIFPDVQSNHTENYHIKYSIMYDLPEFLGEAGSPQVESVLLWWIHIPVTSLASGLQQDDKLTRTPSYLQERRGRRGGGGGGGELKGGVEMRQGKSAGTERRKRKMSTCCIINSLVFLKILCLYFLSLLSLLLPLFLYHFFPSLFFALPSRLLCLLSFHPNSSAGHTERTKGSCVASGGFAERHRPEMKNENTDNSEVCAEGN